MIVSGVDDRIFSRTQTENRMEPPSLPPGFRFHPLDDELVQIYLRKKVLDVNFTVPHIGEADLNKCEPWDLPDTAKLGEKEWYFFALRDRKYVTGMRANRATEAGFWKATGKDREVISSRSSLLVGMKKTLVFYKGRAPRGEKTKWIMHEYRLLESERHTTRLHKDSEWVVCRIFKKILRGKKAYSREIATGTFNSESESLNVLIPLLEYPHPTACRVDPGFENVESLQDDLVTEFTSQDEQDAVCITGLIRSPDQVRVWDPSTTQGVHCTIGSVASIGSSVSDIISTFNFGSYYNDLCNCNQPFSEASFSVIDTDQLSQRPSPSPPPFGLFKLEPYVVISENPSASSQRLVEKKNTLLCDNDGYDAVKDSIIGECFPPNLFRSITPSVDVDIDGMRGSY
ncbi:hypothetical protein O6H91_01G161200 [Diphasiastrum complanatum]|uniref:Uncharacterized protein n=1 Tax=Diphasiastrum complanatum TaxID=34168 RepID=A0ACC2EXX0_DIPCM|nr:hypothetical protein O6H91_01G161200 [Diphasiastrum complanatum]